MRAAVVTAVNGPWEVQNVPEPKPGPNQVLVKMHASGVCYADVHQTLGHLPGAFPRILGHEPVGEIVSVGPGVRTRNVGDRVGVAWVQATCGRCDSALARARTFLRRPASRRDSTSGWTRGTHAHVRRGNDSAARGPVVRTSGANFLRRLHCMERPPLGESQTARACRCLGYWRTWASRGSICKGSWILRRLHSPTRPTKTK